MNWHKAKVVYDSQVFRYVHILNHDISLEYFFLFFPHAASYMSEHQSSIDFQPFSEITKDEGQYHHGWPIKEVSLELA